MDASDIGVPAPAEPRPARFSVSLPRFTDDKAGGIDLIELLGILRRRRSIIVACVTLVTVISAAIVYQITPRYTAESSVILAERKTEVVNVQAVLSGLSNDASVIRSEVEVLKSTPIAQTVVNRLHLTQVPEFNPALQPLSMLAPIRGFGHWVIRAIEPLFGVRPSPAAPTDPAQAALVAATRILQSRTEVVNDGRSYVLRIRVESADPILATQIANTYVDAYLDAQLEAKYEAVKRANDWLNEHLTELRSQVEASDNAVQLFRAQHNLIETSGTNGQTINSQQIAELNTQLVLAAADRAQKESNLQQIQNQLKSGGVDAAAQVLASPLISTLREQETTLLSQQAQLATKYKPEHPAMINIAAQIRDLQLKIKQEIDKVVASMAGDVAAARAKENSLRSSLDSLQKTSSSQSQAEVQLHELQRQADSNRALYENFLNRFKQTSAQEDIQEPDARLLAQAEVPTRPSYPRTGMLIAMAFAGSILLGMFAAFAVERLDNGFRTGDQLEKHARIPAIGLVPDLRTNEAPQDAILTHPVSPYSEAIRTARTALRYSDVDNPPKVVMVTSSLPDEGKSVFSLSLARSVAHSGARAILVDCDLRRPSIAKLLKAEPKPGILSWFDPDADIRNSIQVDEASGLHFVPSSAGTTNPQDLLGSKQLRNVIDWLRGQYDLIVLDTPPVLAVSDALILSHVADTTMFLVRWGRTARPVVLGALKSFRTNGGNIAGVVLSRVDFRRHATYGYGDSGYYYGTYGYRYGRYGRTYGAYGGEAYGQRRKVDS